MSQGTYYNSAVLGESTNKNMHDQSLFISTRAEYFLLHYNGQLDEWLRALESRVGEEVHMNYITI